MPTPKPDLRDERYYRVLAELLEDKRTGGRAAEDNSILLWKLQHGVRDDGPSDPSTNQL